MKRFDPLVESVEHRLLLTTYSVPSLLTPTIQSAINLADLDTTNDTIQVAAGTYTEQLTISKPTGTLAIVPQQPNTIVVVQSPATLTPDANGSRNIVTITGGSQVTIGGAMAGDGLTITGPASSPGAIDTGIFVEGGSTATIQYDSITNIEDSPLDGVQTGVAIQVGQSSPSTLGTATITNDTISGYQKNGITVDGSGSTATITSNSIAGAGPTSVIAQNGIQVSRGAYATISGNTISNNQYTGSASSFATGIYISQPTSNSNGTVVASNTLTGNDFGVFSTGASGTTTSITSNTISGDAAGYGVYSSTAGSTTINGNTIDGNYTGIDSDSSGSTTINGNTLGSTTANSYAGIEVDEGTVTATGDAITGGSIGLNAVSYDGVVSVTLNNSTITNAATGIMVDSTPGEFSTTVTVDHPLTSPATMVTSNVGGAHGAVIVGPSSQLIEAVKPTLTLTANSPVITNNPSGTYNATFTFAGSDNITSANDLVYQYQLDGQTAVATSSPLTLSNLSAGSHTLVLTVFDQGGLSTSVSSTFSNSNTPTLNDFGFETPQLGAGNISSSPSGSPWTFASTSAGSSGISANGSVLTSGNPGAPQGTQVAFLFGNGGTISQSVSGFAGGSYTISFDAAERGNFGGVEDFELLVDGKVVGTFAPASTSYQVFTTGAFTVGAGSHTLQFLGLNSSNGNDTAFLDAVTVAAVPTSGPTPSDFGFETPQLGAGNISSSPSGSPWTFASTSAGSSGISANGSVLTSGNPGAPQGTQVAFLFGNGGTISQSVSGFAGGSYTISFDAAERGNFGGVEDFELLVDGKVVGTFAPASTSYQVFTTGAFTVGAGSHTLQFLGLNSSNGNDTAFLDAVTVAAVPTSGPTPSDFGFETPQLGAGNISSSPSGSPWTFASTSAGSSGISANGSVLTSGNPGAPQGTQVAFLFGNGGTISQSVSGFAGGSYTISFDAAERGNFGGVEDFELLVDGKVVGTFAPASTSYQVFTTGAFTVGAGSHTLQFLGLNSSNGNDTAFLDAVTVAAAPTSGPTPSDPGFETPQLGAGNISSSPSGSPWTFASTSAGSSGISANGSVLTSGNPGAPQGTQVAFLFGNGGTISQSVGGFAAGGSYTISFDAAMRGNFGGAEDFEVLINGTVVGTFKPTTTSYQLFTTASFTASAGSNTIEFLGLNSSNGNDTAFLDNVTIASAP